MKVLISGATGFVGRHLVQALRGKSHQVMVLTRNPTQARRELGDGVSCHGWDPSEFELALKDCYAVVHLAGENVGQRWTPQAKKRILDSRVLSTRALLKGISAVQSDSLKVFISASAVGYYGDRGDEELNEASSSGSDFLADVCRQWEQEVSLGLPRHLRSVVLRLGLVLGRDGGPLKKMLPAFQLGLGGPLGKGKQWMSWIHVDDLVDIVMRAIENSQYQGVFNAVAPNPVVNKYFTRVLGQQLRRPTFFKAPAPLLKLVMGEMSGILLGGQKVRPQRLQEIGHTFAFPTIDKALSDLL